MSDSSKNPIQPIQDDCGTLRFKGNAIVEHLYNFSLQRGLGLNELAAMEFTRDDRQQFAQLLGYSLSGYGDLSYVDNYAFNVAQSVAEGEVETIARIVYLENELKEFQDSVRVPIAKLFGIHPDDLNCNK